MKPSPAPQSPLTVVHEDSSEETTHPLVEPHNENYVQELIDRELNDPSKETKDALESIRADRTATLNSSLPEHVGRRIGEIIGMPFVIGNALWDAIVDATMPKRENALIVLGDDKPKEDSDSKES